MIMLEEETIGKMHHATAETYAHRALAYQSRGMTEGAINTKAINIQRMLLGNGHPRVEELMTALVVFKQEKNAKALTEQGLAMNAQGD